jgi:UDP-N-acetyl-2-amino-2-deoxyglucuronate dehydrogenase
MRPLNTLLVGCGAMGRSQAGILAKLPGYRLIAVADVVAASAQSVAETHGCAHGTDAVAMMRELRPEVVAICTGNATHAELTLAAAAHGAKAVYCEKPMAVDLDDARRMVAACAAAGTRLVVNHQRRTGADLRAMRQAIASGAIGKVRRVRMQNAGDTLSDGTHAIDSLRYLLGDAPWERVVGQMHRGDPAAKPPPKAQSDRAGWRFGHPVEDGMMAEIDFAGGIRAEVLCGDLVEGYTAYQHYEVFGTTGRLWRWGDCQACAASSGAGPGAWNGNVLIADGRPGTHQAVFDVASWPYRAHPAPGGDWRLLELDGDPLRNLIADAYTALASCLESGAAHPMDGSVGLADMELVTAIYASAERRAPVKPGDLPGTSPLWRMYGDDRMKAAASRA